MIYGNLYFLIALKSLKSKYSNKTHHKHSVNRGFSAIYAVLMCLNNPSFLVKAISSHAVIGFRVRVILDRMTKFWKSQK